MKKRLLVRYKTLAVFEDIREDLKRVRNENKLKSIGNAILLLLNMYRSCSQLKEREG